MCVRPSDCPPVSACLTVCLPSRPKGFVCAKTGQPLYIAKNAKSGSICRSSRRGSSVVGWLAEGRSAEGGESGPPEPVVYLQARTLASSAQAPPEHRNPESRCVSKARAKHHLSTYLPTFAEGSTPSLS